MDRYSLGWGNPLGQPGTLPEGADSITGSWGSELFSTLYSYKESLVLKWINNNKTGLCSFERGRGYKNVWDYFLL